MHEKSRNYHAQILVPKSNKHNNPFGDAIYGAGSDLIKTELSAYSEKPLGSSSSYVHSNLGRLLSNPRYYFQGHLMRVTDNVEGELCYKLPIYDINAPDLYIPLMAFGTYLVLAGFFLGINGKFSPEALGVQFSNGLICWLFQVLLLEATLHNLGDGDIPLLDVAAYGGYIFVAVSVVLMARIVGGYCFYVVALWESVCMGMFLVKILKKILIAAVRIPEKHSSKRHYLLLLVAFAQLPLLFWLGNVSV